MTLEPAGKRCQQWRVIEFGYGVITNGTETDKRSAALSEKGERSTHVATMQIGVCLSSQPRSLLSTAKLQSARSLLRPSTCSFVRIRSQGWLRAGQLPLVRRRAL
jgi:hypothetical protein